MIITHDHDAFESQLPPNTKSYSIQDSPIAFKLLSDNLYKNKILAVIRELSCNAHDAHVAAGKPKTPFNLHLPTEMDPVFRVEDFGIGLPPTGPGSVEELYISYFASSKRLSNKFIGALGLGSKSPFAYTNNFTIKTRWQGEEHTFISCVDEKYQPSTTLVGSAPTDQPNGLTVEFAVKPADFHHFSRNASECFRYWTVKPKLTGAQIRFETANPVPNFNGSDWMLEQNPVKRDRATAIMGNVPYPIRLDDANLTLTDELKFILTKPFAIRFKMGALNFAPSREDLSYDGVTNKALLEAAERIAVDLKDQMLARINSAATLPEFAKQLKVEVDSLAQASGSSSSDIVKFFTGAIGSKTLTFKGIEFTIKELMRNVWNFHAADGHGSRGLQVYRDAYGRGRENATFVAKTTNADDLFTMCNWDIASWFSPKVIASDRMPVNAKSLKNKLADWGAKAKFGTYYQVSLADFPVFVVNDMPRGGYEKVRAYLRKTRQPVYILEMHKDEATSVGALVTWFSALLRTKFKDETPIVLPLSQLPDHREKEEKVEEKGPRKPRTNITEVEVYIDKGKSQPKHTVLPELFGDEKCVEGNYISYSLTEKYVKLDQVEGFYIFKFFGNLYYNLGHSIKFRSEDLEFLYHAGVIKPTDKIYMFGLNDDRRHKTKLQPLQAVVEQALKAATVAELEPFYAYEQLTEFDIIRSLTDLRRMSKRGSAHRGKDAKKCYQRALKALIRYKRTAKKQTPFKKVIDQMFGARRAVQQASTNAWKYLCFKHLVGKFDPANATKTTLDKYTFTKKNDKLNEAYPLLEGASYTNKFLVAEMIEYIQMLDAR